MNYAKVLTNGLLASLCSVLAITVGAEPVTYNIDSGHTFPSFAADHASGFSIWRGKIKETSGTIVLDQAAQTGTVEVVMQIASLDFGHDGMNAHAMTADFFDVERFPTATYTGTLVGFEGGSPTAVEGSLTMHGITRPLDLDIVSLVCIDAHRMTNRPACGAEITGSLDRADWDMTFDSGGVHQTWVTLNIQVEARAE